MKRFVDIIALPAVILLILPCAEAAIPQAERDALIAIYDSTGGPGWGNSTNWLGGPGTECTWFGVACSGGDANVIELHLGGNNLNGVLPPEIQDLTELEGLFMPWNQLIGGIPPEIGTLEMLHTLDLPGNRLSGSIPPDLGSIGVLQWINLAQNRLSGSIPPELGYIVEPRVVREQPKPPHGCHSNRVRKSDQLGGDSSLGQ